jgi:hypothetical protein
MPDLKLVALGFALCAWCEFAQAQVHLRTDTIESARTEKGANLKPETPPKAERDIEWIEHMPYYGAGPVTVYLRRGVSRIEVVGIDR